MGEVNWIAQAIGILGVGCFLISFQIKSNKALLLLQALADFLFGIQFVLLKGYTGCINMVLIVIRNVFITYRDKYEIMKLKIWKYVFISLFVIVSILTWEGIRSILPIIACVFVTYAYFDNNARKYRTYNLFIACPCWLIYDFFVKSYAGMLNEFLSMMSITLSIIRFGWNSLGDNIFEKDKIDGNQ